MEILEPRVGDMISVSGALGYRHYGIVVGWQQPHGYTVVHNAKGEGVILDWIQSFFNFPIIWYAIFIKVFVRRAFICRITANLARVCNDTLFI